MTLLHKKPELLEISKEKEQIKAPPSKFKE